MMSDESSPFTVLAFVSGKGGVGKTTLAAAVAHELSAGTRTLVLDLDFFNRGLSALLTKGDAVEHVESPPFVEEGAQDNWSTWRVREGLYAVAAPDLTQGDLAHLHRLPVHSLAQQLKEWLDGIVTRLGCQAVVIDCHGGPDPLSFAVTIFADRVLLISEPDKITMYGTLHFLRQLKSCDIEDQNVHLVFNKVGEHFTSRFLFRVYDARLRTYFHDKALLAVFPMENYLTKHFEQGPFVTEAFPRSMLARKTQVMLVDVLDGGRLDLLSDFVRRLPAVVKEYRRRFFGRTPKILDVEFVLVTLWGAVIAVFVCVATSGPV